MLSNYLARMAVTSVGSLARPNTHVLAEVDLPLRIWPSDLDIWAHVNNGRYLTLMDHGRLDHGLRTGLLPAMFKRRCRPLLGGVSVQYRREVRAFERCTLVTQVAAWDEKWLYYEQRLERRGELCARAVVRAVLKIGRETLPPAELLADVGVHSPSPVAPETLTSSWTGAPRARVLSRDAGGGFNALPGLVTAPV
ncbi:acyl-CoA thioesterase [Pyxidicoccus fallax]|uniref:acyl-CoA thioesterase n=1 Tax=Pyxidicoccus fallax TaxID=394095 RepID=UPI001B7D4CAA|nr:acyl-CoA thioesterase [Pyxidicoccus fallax]